MRRPSPFLVVVLAQCVFSLVAPQSFDFCIAQPGNGEGNMLPLSTTLVPVADATVRKIVYTTVRWEGREYTGIEGINFLLQVIVDPATDPSLRAKALDKLSKRGNWLQNTDHISELIQLYDNLTERREKGELLKCLAHFEDRRALPLLVKVLDGEQDSTLRLVAAAGLARWNIRSGVKELIELFPSTVDMGNRELGANATITFNRLNRKKGWACPEEQIRQAALSASNGNRDEYAKGLLLEYREWFEANKNRFPDWKLGDPLPEAPGKAPRPKPSD